MERGNRQNGKSVKSMGPANCVWRDQLPIRPSGSLHRKQNCEIQSLQNFYCIKCIFWSLIAGQCDMSWRVATGSQERVGGLAFRKVALLKNLSYLRFCFLHKTHRSKTWSEFIFKKTTIKEIITYLLIPILIKRLISFLWFETLT